jgi:hypothetical protein
LERNAPGSCEDERVLDRIQWDAASKQRHRGRRGPACAPCRMRPERRDTRRARASHIGRKWRKPWAFRAAPSAGRPSRPACAKAPPAPPLDRPTTPGNGMAPANTFRFSVVEVARSPTLL